MGGISVLLLLGILSTIFWFFVAIFFIIAIFFCLYISFEKFMSSSNPLPLKPREFQYPKTFTPFRFKVYHKNMVLNNFLLFIYVLLFKNIFNRDFKDIVYNI